MNLSHPNLNHNPGIPKPPIFGLAAGALPFRDDPNTNPL